MEKKGYIFEDEDGLSQKNCGKDQRPI